jgi:hypothetical protein
VGRGWHVCVWLLAALCAARVPAEEPHLPVLRANSPVVDVRDGNHLLKGIWAVDPAVPLDIYDAKRSAAPKRITFISDIDSLSFDVEPGHTYDFIIELGKKDCRTRIATTTPSVRRVSTENATAPAIVPIRIVDGKLHLSGTINDSSPLDLIFDTGASINVVYPSASRRGAALEYDGQSLNTGTGGTTRRKTSSGNRLHIADLVADRVNVMYVEKQAESADGIVSYAIFEDKVVEFDYDRMVMLIHDALPAYSARFRKTALSSAGALTAVDVGVTAPGGVASGALVLDSAGTGSIVLNHEFVAKHRAALVSLRELGRSESRGVGNAVVQNELALANAISIAGFELKNVPVDMELPSQRDGSSAGGLICMEVLQRFNTILDYPRGESYFKPNSHFGAPFKRRHSQTLMAVIGGFAVASVVLVAAFWLRRRGRRVTP